MAYGQSECEGLERDVECDSDLRDKYNTVVDLDYCYGVHRIAFVCIERFLMIRCSVCGVRITKGNFWSHRHDEYE